MKGSYYTIMELKTLNIIQSVIDGTRTGKEAAIALNISNVKFGEKLNLLEKMVQLALNIKIIFTNLIILFLFILEIKSYS